MKRVISIVIMIVMLIPLSVNAEEIDFKAQGFEVMYTTAYHMGHHTANGSKVHHGGCACNKEHLGDVAIIYTLDGDFLGYYECNDTGGTEGLNKGVVIDVYRCNLTQCQSYMKITGGKVYVKWISGKG